MANVVITGIGLLSPYGGTPGEFWEGLSSNKRIFSPLPGDIRNMKGIYGRIDESLYRPVKNNLLTTANDFCKLGFNTARLAVQDSGLKIDPYNTCIISGCAFGYSPIDQFADMLDLRKSMYIYNASVNCLVGISENIRGMHLFIYSSETASTSCIGLGAGMIRSGKFKAALVGGIEIFSKSLYLSYALPRTVSPMGKNPERFSRMEDDIFDFEFNDHEIRSLPWDKNRNGFVFSETSCYMVLEDEQQALQRGARIYAHVLGYGSAHASGIPLYSADSSGVQAEKTIQKALDSAGKNFSDIDFIMGASNGVIDRDLGEALALGSLGKQSGRRPAVTSIKSTAGDCLGASGILNAAASIIMSGKKTLSPVCGTEEPIDEVAGLDLVMSSREIESENLCLVNDVGFKGDTASLLIRNLNWQS